MLLSPLAAQAQQRTLIDFEQSPATQPGQPATVGVATFRGGFILRNTTYLPSNPSAVYFSADVIGQCTLCSRDVTIQFSEPVSNIEFTFVNGVTATYFAGLYFYHFTVDDNTAPTALGFPPYDLNDATARGAPKSTSVGRTYGRCASARLRRRRTGTMSSTIYRSPSIARFPFASY